MIEAAGHATRRLPDGPTPRPPIRSAGIRQRLLLLLFTASSPILVSLAAATYVAIGAVEPGGPGREAGHEIVERLAPSLVVLLGGLVVSGAVALLLVRRFADSVGRLAERASIVAGSSSAAPPRSPLVADLPVELAAIAESLDLIAESDGARQRDLGELTRSLVRSRQLLTKTLANLREGVLILDADTGNVVDCNSAIARIFGYERDAIIGHSPDLLHLTKESAADFRSQMEMAFAERGFLRHPGLRLCRVDGSVAYADITAVPLDGEAGHQFGTLCVIHDVTELRQYERRLAYLATHDQLTGLPSRRGLEEGVAEAVAVAADGGLESALLLVDIVRFRDINDALGHQAGDEVLAAVARCIQISLRGTDVAARLGNDEFAVLLRWTEYGAARLVAERLRRTVETEFSRLGAGRFSLKLSIGMALVDGSLQMTGVLGRATAALLEAKRGGGDRIVMTLDGYEPTSRAECS